MSPYAHIIQVFALAALCQQDDFRTFHIVRYQQAWLEDDGTLYIQTELCSATLRDEMSGRFVATTNGTTTAGGGRTQTVVVDAFRHAKILREVLLGLELVHQRGMVHLDIKPENIFVKNDLYKIGDFGLANAWSRDGVKSAATPDIEEGDSRYMSRDLLDFTPKDLTKVSEQPMCSVFFARMIQQHAHNHLQLHTNPCPAHTIQCDIFSLGATMYEVCFRRSLPTCGQEWQDLRNGKLPSAPLLGTMPCLASIVREMMHPDPEKRPGATELLSRDVLAAGVDNPMSYKVGSARKANLPKPSLKRSASWVL